MNTQTFTSYELASLLVAPLLLMVFIAKQSVRTRLVAKLENTGNMEAFAIFLDCSTTPVPGAVWMRQRLDDVAPTLLTVSEL